MTATELLKALAPLRPAVDGCELVLSAAPPAAVAAAVRALQTGLRSLLTGRPWYAHGVDGRGVGPLRDGALNPSAVLPWAATHLCVAGDHKWDVLRISRRHDLPLVFGPPPARRPHRPTTAARRCPHLPLRAS